MSDTATPAVVRRSDYSPPTFLIESAALEFDLVPERTLVSNTMRVRRNPDAAPASHLELMGEALELVSVSIDGAPHAQHRTHEHGLVLEGVPDAFELTIVSTCNPASNTTLSGLYVSSGSFFTQCEAEGFRRITYFLDRPDVMSTYTVTLRADKTAYPVLLSNGNLVDSGELPDGRHYAKWEDPFKKPSYLFALVAGKLVALEERIRTGSGKEKLLQVWVEPHDLDKTRHAMDSLIHAIRWDEKRFGLELDLDRFMIVAVSDFNMGAMENKGLNIFNTKYVLANPETATDTDFANIEAVVGHEYFHNWTGNRVTCRDWFQLSLKEGLTVFRDQEFSADMQGGADDEAARAVKRIEDVRVLRQMQFAEDAGPMAHPVRPESYVEINNFYTMTVYEKGAEVVRMYQTLFGRDGFRRGMDLYFERHDGQAVTCDDFRHAMADANGRDLAQFERWYSQAGTPRVNVRTAYDAGAKRYTVTLSQRYAEAAPAAHETQKGPLLIPFAIGLIGRDGNDLPLRLEGEPNASGTTRVLDLTAEDATFTFVDVPEAPLPSLLRNFSAPVIVEYEYTPDELAFLLAHDSDPFNRWEAGQRLATRELLTLAGRAANGLDNAVVAAFARVLTDETLSPAFRELALVLPSESYLAEQMVEADPAAVHAARQFMRKRFAVAMREAWLDTYAHHVTPGGYEPSAQAAGQRALKNLALAYLAELDDPADAIRLATAQYDSADNMTDRAAALSALLAAAATSGAPTAERVLDDFYRRFEREPLVIDKWFAMQATQRGSAGRPVIEIVRKLMTHPAFTLRNPNRARSLIFSFCSANPSQFHAPDGSGYAFWAEQVIALDALNPQVAARLARALELWRRYTPSLREKMRAALERVAAQASSRDVREIVDKALA
ncbi:aminopeptidase N [Trinickia caryophylli]|uniref:Aminopeptidase N n=1 Tax=Trinickia caryophylli TaxID=28094 RepID=A0A1X7CLM2_TRICW|nr:aminopeptidase N [Trinickia caryophylli]PMS09082.1 aminopeptidase N [Trinickia caryophylli]TRX20033.1 aminopeptidase N [Trinickia caryophylli]WQE12620.1 aminopeptidase N [Trinickia caryophylli]SME98822.1 alanyl aminopeptidase. Metallo peptidase. MEROPS family M01 [Trinickia caryophylli]GLU30320.1 aminopeptidase N [Trinickia caryophylli]